MSSNTIIAAGGSNDGTSFAIIRYLSDGSRDPSFGTGGLVLTRFGVDTFDTPGGLVVQADKKIVVVGQSADAIGKQSFAVARYNADGSLDAGFGTGGLFTTDFGVDDASSTAVAVALQDDGKIVITGIQSTLTAGWGIIRLLANGTLDSSFGTGGKVMTAVDGDGNTFNAARGVAIQGDGKIVAAGDANQFPTNFGLFAVARYNTDGTLDTAGFGTGGIVVTSFGGVTENSIPNGVAIQGDGKIVAAGQTDPDGTHFHFAFARYNTNGTLDSAGFGTGGKTEVSFSDPSFGQSLALQGDGKIVVAGSVNGVTSVFALVRLNTDGTLDSTGFGTGGKVTTNFGDGGDHGNALVIEDDGLLVVAGQVDSATTGIYGLARYNTDGTLDTSFDTDGFLTDAGAFLATAVALSSPLIPSTLSLLQPANFAGNFRTSAGGYCNA